MDEVDIANERNQVIANILVVAPLLIVGIIASIASIVLTAVDRCNCYMHRNTTY